MKTLLKSATLVTPDPEVQLKTVGINSSGVPYYDASGAAVGEVASITTVNGVPTAVSTSGATAPLLTTTGAAGAYAPGGGGSLVITGPALLLATGAALPSGREYVWNKTDGAGTLLDIISGVAA